ncbi:GNAT family N-acetyltransferase [Methylobacterium gnaphalii]|uniref:GNAT family N-acetyltransferase n=1 Tax=Methylobacterium gnaphalii TaxID=1010610 RepID=UPI001EE2D86C|nr:GNAT family N-acetyltransferase [Methylobacterium gnaphalii]
MVLIALEWGPPSGIIVVHWHQTLEFARPVSEISTLLVSPDARRRGIGRLLLKAAARAARQAGCETIRVSGVPPKSELQQFCAANGFLSEGVCLHRPLRKAGGRGDD